MRTRLCLVAPATMALALGISISPVPATALAQEAKPAAGGSLTLERLWDRWQARRSSPRAKASPSPSAEEAAGAPPSQSEPFQEKLAEQFEAPQPVQKEGDFPVFRTGDQPPVSKPATTPVPATASLTAPAPRPLPVEATMPAAAPTAVMASHEAPLEAPAQPTAPARVALRSAKATTQPIAPAGPASPLRRTSAYLAEDVRYGTVIRRSRNTSLDPTSDILGDVQMPLVAPAPAPAKVQVPEALERALSGDDTGPGPQAVPLAPEDARGLRSLLPAASHGGVLPAELEAGAAVNVSAAASAAALQQALRRYAAPAAQQGIELVRPGDASPRQQPPPPTVNEPQPQAEFPPEFPPQGAPAAGAHDSSQRSVLLGGAKPFGIDGYAIGEPAVAALFNSKSRSPRTPATTAKGSRGSVAGVDKETRTILVIFPDGRLPAVGSKVQVFQKVFFKRQLLGEFEVIDYQDNGAVAQPIGRIDLDLILNGDEAAAL